MYKYNIYILYIYKYKYCIYIHTNKSMYHWIYFLINCMDCTNIRHTF